ncbi:TcpE family conjugal transfer membrane protein [Sporosarcina sp. P2]|uniref:TcpE family conjugal transfer membrane protein n=1 Tax=Sporosarcina sp. P2 TaxID=2048251 RepID=UPI00130411BD|nr:TcpE family conjugal transfer membrane protein [Sporosarcina sp. P2]
MLNNFIRFERQLYQIFGLELGRPIRLKAIMYFFVIAIVEATIYFTPGIGRLINWIPVGILILIPIELAWLLADVGTEGRSPVNFFRSFILYQARKVKASTIYRGREVEKEKDYQFHNYFTFNEPIHRASEDTSIATEVDEKRKNAIEYMTRISNRRKVSSEKQVDHKNNETEVVRKVEDEELPEIETEQLQQETNLKKTKERINRSPLVVTGITVLFTMALSVALVFGFLYTLTDFKFGKANVIADDLDASLEKNKDGTEKVVVSIDENLIIGLRAASIQKYGDAVEYFDKLDFVELEKADRNSVLFTYLMSGNAQKALDHVPEFDKSIVGYYVAKNDLKPLLNLQTDSELITFEVASLNNDYEKIVEFQSAERMEIDDRRAHLIVDAYIALERVDDAIDFAESIDDNSLRSYIQEKTDAKDLEKEKEEKKKKEAEESNGKA